MTSAPDDLRYPIGKFTPPGDVVAEGFAEMRQQIENFPRDIRAATDGLTDAQLDTPYRDGGWTVRQTVHHVADSHMNAYCRFRLALTEDQPTIKPYLEAAWAELTDARTMPLEPSLQILDGMHLRWIALIDAMEPDHWQRAFVHPEHGTSRTLWYTLALYAWHCRHHGAHIRNLRTRNGW